MAHRILRLRIRLPSALGAALAVVVLVASLLLPKRATAFGEVGAFDPRVLLTGNQKDAARASAPARWAWEVVQRTSAPARLKPTTVRASDPQLIENSFLFWSGIEAVEPLTSSEIAGLRRFFALGGMMVVDDADPGTDGAESAFARTARRELGRVLPESTPIDLAEDHVIYRTFYLLRRAEGRVEGKALLQGIVRGGMVQVVFTTHDLGGALARSPSGIWEQSVVPGGDFQRERAIRLAVNLALYAQCSNYKDDQVHAPFLMRRRALGASMDP
jgi:hypothetical protein